MRESRAVAPRPPPATTGYRRNVEALAGAEPADLGPLEIAVSLGAPWLDAKDVELFVREVLGGAVKVWHLPSAAMWKIVPTGRVPVTRFTDRARMARTTCWPRGSTGGRRSSSTPSSARPAAAASATSRPAWPRVEMLTDLQDRFRTWLWEDESRTVRLCREYNRRFNSTCCAVTTGRS